MAAAEIRSGNICLTLTSTREGTRLLLAVEHKGDCDLPCRIENLTAVLNGFRYHIVGAGISATLERQANSIKLSFIRDGYSEYFVMPAKDFEAAVQAITPPGKAYMA